MLDLMNMHPTGKDIHNAIPVYIITKEGADYTPDGIKYVKSSMYKNFEETKNKDLLILTGVALNNPKFLKSRLEKNENSYVVLSTKNDVIFIPKHNNKAICENMGDAISENPDMISWEILMESCHQELY